MPFSEILRQALQNIRGNMLRSVLTLLIIAMGILSLVGILTTIDSLAYSLNDSFSGLGANSFNIERKWGEVKSNRGGHRERMGDLIKFKQAMDFKARFDMPSRVSLSFQASGQVVIKAGEEETNPNIAYFGIDENFLAVKGMNIAFGRNISQTEAENGANVILIGNEIAKKLFKDKPGDALEKNIVVGTDHYKVVGVLESKGSSMNNSSDRAVYAPLLTVKNRYANENTNYDLTVSVQQAADLDQAISEATGLFRVIRGLKAGELDDFDVVTSNSMAEILKENTRTLQIATIVIGLMTLLGASIGLMNIMLVSVTERTREIGIYKALGATKRNILTQFLTEAILICQMGGIVGIVLGIIIGNLLTLKLGGSFYTPWSWIFFGFSLCMVVGIVSGFYPAMKAAQLDPIESLRFE